MFYCFICRTRFRKKQINIVTTFIVVMEALLQELDFQLNGIMTGIKVLQPELDIKGNLKICNNQ